MMQAFAFTSIDPPIMAELDVDSLSLKTPNEFELRLEPKHEIPRALKSTLIDASCANDRPHESTSDRGCGAAHYRACD